MDSPVSKHASDKLQGHQNSQLCPVLQLIPAPLVAAYHRRMVNIHPGLLPEFGGPSMYGMRVHAATLAAGEILLTSAGCHDMSGMDIKAEWQG